jgi:peptidoglycan hydrolase CwlO-like protein
MDLKAKQAELEGMFDQIKKDVEEKEQVIQQTQGEIQNLMADLNRVQGAYLIVKELLDEEVKSEPITPEIVS